ncbi:MAG: formylglycine-generating enzyme family protein [Myxococcales bacterium FL481]|nr:MAG: formylglycine-generating enzyme family protein [Myxococcales bacterium FL481]
MPAAAGPATSTRHIRFVAGVVWNPGMRAKRSSDAILRHICGGSIRTSVLFAAVAGSVIGCCSSSKGRADDATPAPSDDGRVAIPAGRFEMGSSDGPSDERPIHGVSVAAFRLDRTPVTIAAYRKCVDAGACREPGAHKRVTRGFESFCNWEHPDGASRNSHPVNCVDWEQAAAYCKWSGGRLPTEEEWAYAARRSGGPYAWGAEPPDQSRLNVCGQSCVDSGERAGFRRWRRASWEDDGHPETSPVGSFPAGATPDGLLDMAGNVWEWTSSAWRPDYDSGPREGAADVPRALRGSCWIDSKTAKTRSAKRYWAVSSKSTAYIGFRCAAN